MDVVTGAFSFTGRYIAARLLEAGREVRTLTRRPESESPFGDRVRAFPLDPDGIAAALDGAETLYNTYWIRFPNASTSFEDAVGNSVALFDAARAAGVRRVVQLSVTNAAAGSPYAYFRGKAAVEEALAGVGPLARDRQADARVRRRRGARQQRGVAPPAAARLRRAARPVPDPADRRGGPRRAVRRSRPGREGRRPSTRRGRTSSASRSSCASCVRRSAPGPSSCTEGGDPFSPSRARSASSRVRRS